MPSATQDWMRAIRASGNAAGRGLTLPALLPGLAERYGDAPALLGEGEALSYRALAARAARIEAWAAAADLHPGDTVGLLMPGRPDYVATWLGLAGAGCVVALLNTNLVGDGLLHCIATANCRGLIVAPALLPAIDAISGRLAPGTRIWVHGGHHLWPEFAPVDGAAVPRTASRPTRLLSDRALLIYTSGTTGMPKAAVVTHGRIIEWSYWFAGLTAASPQDCMYDCLPLYHSVGGIVAVGAMLVSGGSVLIRDRFSASGFWDDVAEGGCTMVQYIGELWRYLLNAGPHPRETGHRLRLACGNGLSGDIWAKVQQRFAVPRILEFYAATEGGVSLYNVEGRPGAIGHLPSFLPRSGVALVQVDAETGDPLRGPDGHCIACGADEAGEAIGLLADGRRFDGYTDASQSSSKVLRDVFEPGDRWFRTGDLLRRDAGYFFYFVDRLGDSFRWKGENVSTAEVSAVLRACPGVTDAAVYGVRVPGHDGRCGMAAVISGQGFNPALLRDRLQAALPRYAQPLFVRICRTLDVTGTFKLAKARLAKEGFAGLDDPVLFNDHEAGQFVLMDAALAADIAAGTRRL